MKINQRFLFPGIFSLIAFCFFTSEAQKPDLIIQTGHSDVISALAFSPDGALLASSSYDGTVKIWEVTTGKEIRTIFANSIFKYLNFSDSGQTLYGGEERPSLAWEVASGKSIPLTNAPASNPTFSGDGRLSVSACWSEGTITLSDTTTKKEIWTIADENRASAAAISFDGKLISSGNSIGNIKIWDVNRKQLIKTFRTITDSVTSIAIRPDNKMIATGSGLFQGAKETDSIKLWDAESGALIHTFTGKFADVYTLKFSPDGKLLISSTRDSVTAWDMATRKERARLSEGSQFGESYVFINDGQTLLRGGTDLEPWISPSGWIESYNLLNGKSIKRVGFENVSVLTINNTGKLCVLSYEPEFDEEAKPWVKIVNTTTGKDLLTLPQGAALATFSSDSNKLFTFTDKQTNIWSLKNGQKLKTLPGGLRNALSPNGILLAVAEGNEIIVYHTLTGKRLSTLTTHAADVTSMSFTSDSKFLLSGSLDASTKIWDATTGKELASLIAFDENDWLVTTPEGFFDGTPAAWKQLIWRFNNNTFDYASVETYFNDFFHPNLLQDVLAGKSPKPKPGQELEKIDRRQPTVEIANINGLNKAQLENQSPLDKKSANVTVEAIENLDKPKRANQQASSEVQDLRLFRNGSLVKIWHGATIDEIVEKSKSECQISNTSNNSRRKLICQTAIPIVAGNNTLTAYAFNSANIKSNDDSVSIKGAESLKRDGTLYVVAVGVNDYTPPGKSNLDLNFAVPDVTDISNAIKTQQIKIAQDRDLRQYVRTEIITLTNEEATKDNILLALKRFSAGGQNSIPGNASEKLKVELMKIKPTQPEDAVLIYYAGHGTSREQRFYLLPHNFTDAKEIEKQGISDLELNEVLEKVDAGKLLMVIDACQSGQALGEKNEGRAPMNSKGLAQLAYDKGMLILTAAQSQQAALEAVKIGGKEVKHGLLTYALLEAFTNKSTDKDGNQQLWEREWFDYTVEQVPQLQLEAMKQRRAEIKQTGRGSEIIYLEGDDPNQNPDKRRVQTPRVFYRRETENNPLIVAKP